MSIPVTSPLLEFKDVTIIKNGKTILNSISLIIGKEDNIAILGPNGSGKSTLVKTILREHYPAVMEKESIFHIWGQDTWDAFVLRSHFGIVSSELQYVFTKKNIPGKEVLLSGFFSSIGLFHHQITHSMEERVHEVAKFLEIEDLMDRSIMNMSSGEGRRILIGRALVHKPAVLILDEPTNSLDLHALHILRQYLRKIAQSGLRIILVTHQIHDIIPEINHVVMMKEGTIFKSGKKEDLLIDETVKSLFSIPIHIRKEEGFYYATGY